MVAIDSFTWVLTRYDRDGVANPGMAHRDDSLVNVLRFWDHHAPGDNNAGEASAGKSQSIT